MCCFPDFLQGNNAQAKKGFEEILLYEGLDAKTKALVLKQLGKTIGTI